MLTQKQSDEAYKLRVETDTGRATEYVEVKCGSCNGHGAHQFSQPCESCLGEGKVKALVFTDCGHEVDTNDCVDEGCNRCQTSECDNERERNEDRCKECLETEAYWKAQYDSHGRKAIPIWRSEETRDEHVDRHGKV